MVEPLTLALVGGTVLTEGVKFLYQQAGKVIERWLNRRTKGGTTPTGTEPVETVPTEVLRGRLGSQLTIHYDQLAGIVDELRAARRQLSEYADGTLHPAADDTEFAREVDHLRRLLEVALQERITFAGEQREPSGPAVFGRAHVGDVAPGGSVAGVSATRLSSGQVTGEAVAGTVYGTVRGAEIGEIGST